MSQSNKPELSHQLSRQCNNQFSTYWYYDSQTLKQIQKQSYKHKIKTKKIKTKNKTKIMLKI